MLILLHIIRKLGKYSLNVKKIVDNISLFLTIQR